MTSTTAAPAPALKEIFNVSRFRHVAEEAAAVYPRFDSAAFLAHALPGLNNLTLMQRLRRSFRLDALMADSELAAPILENLKADPNLYVRR